MSIEKFISEIAKSLREETFVKLTLGNYKGADEQLQKLLVRLIKTRKGGRLFFYIGTKRVTRPKITVLTKASTFSAIFWAKISIVVIFLPL